MYKRLRGLVQILGEDQILMEMLTVDMTTEIEMTLTAEDQTHTGGRNHMVGEITRTVETLVVIIIVVMTTVRGLHVEEVRRRLTVSLITLINIMTAEGVAVTVGDTIAIDKLILLFRCLKSTFYGTQLIVYFKSTTAGYTMCEK